MTRQQIIESATESERQQILELEQRAAQGISQLSEIAREIPRALEERERRRSRRTWVTALIAGTVGWLVYLLWRFGPTLAKLVM